MIRCVVRSRFHPDGCDCISGNSGHEVGHALSLEQVEADSGASDNLMISTGAMSRLTVEQVERVNRSLDGGSGR